MAYKNQNYMTNCKIRGLVKKNQKGYQEEGSDNPNDPNNPNDPTNPNNPNDPTNPDNPNDPTNPDTPEEPQPPEEPEDDKLINLKVSVRRGAKGISGATVRVHDREKTTIGINGIAMFEDLPNKVMTITVIYDDIVKTGTTKKDIEDQSVTIYLDD